MKRIISMALTLILVLGMFPCTAAAAGRDVSYEETLAADLKELGLFKGVSETNFNLGREPSRVEALVMLIRVLGKEQEALNGSWEHPFTDVPKWANQYVGYAYENKLTNGITATEFGTGNADARTYLTFVLRALGYSDAGGEDFTWNQPYALASEVGILVDCVDLTNFWRADVVLVSYAALPVALKGSEQTLAEKLIASGAFSRDAFETNYDPDFLKNVPAEKEENTPAPTPAAGEKLTAQEIAEKCSDAVFYITCYAFNGEISGSGSGFFISSDGLAVTNFHVAANCSTLSITTTDGTVYDSVKIIDGYSGYDLAILRVEGSGFKYLELADSDEVKQGQRVYAIGSPRGLANTMSEGIIANPKRTIEGTTYIQISVPIAPGSSGGALIDEYGKVVGVTTAGYTDTTGDLNLAVGSNFIREMDTASTGSYVFWENVFYNNFSQVFDFGAFTGAAMVDYGNIPLGYVIVYDIWDFYDTPDDTASENYAYSLWYYQQALQKNGFVKTDGEEGAEGVYETDTERVSFGSDFENNAIYVIAEWIPEYYTQCSAVPDLGWYLNIDRDQGELIDGSWVYVYDWETYYYEEDFLFWLGLYCDLLEDEGFELAYEESGAYLFEGKGLSIVIAYDEQYASVDVLPLS